MGRTVLSGRTWRLVAAFTTAGLLLALGVGAASPAGAAFGDHRWTKSQAAGGPAAFDAYGEMTIAGVFFGTVDFGGGPLTAANALTGDVYLARFDGSGDLLWTRQFSPLNQAGLFNIVIASAPDGSIYIAGNLIGSDLDFGGGVISAAGASRGVLAAFDRFGNHQWSFAIGSGLVLDLVASDDRVVGVGELDPGPGIDFGGGPLVSAGGDDAFAFELSPSGSHRWSRRFGDSAGQSSNAVAIDENGDVVIAGGMNGTVDFGGGPLTALAIDLFVVGLDPTGAHRWSRQVTGTIAASTSPRRPIDLAVGPSGEIAFAGSYRDDIDLGGGPLFASHVDDIFLARYDRDGQHLWSATYGTTGTQLASSVDVDAVGNVLLAGSFATGLDLGGGELVAVGPSLNHYLALFDATGAHLFSASYGAGSTNAAVFDAAWDVRLFGFSGNADFGGGPVVSAAHYVKLEGGLNSPTGESVSVLPVDETTGDSPMSLVFDSIVTAGETSLTTSVAGPPPLAGFSIGSGLYFDLSTTASFSGSVQICLRYDEATIPGDENELVLLHYENAVTGWVDVTTSLDPEANVICGTTTSFSPFVIAAPTSTTASPSAGVSRLRSIAPNPSNPRATIVMHLSENAGLVQLDVYDTRGRWVHRLLERDRVEGTHIVVWDGRTHEGRQAASGVYFVRLRARDADEVQKLVLVQ